MLSFDPKDRPTASEILQNPFFSSPIHPQAGIMVQTKKEFFSTLKNANQKVSATVDFVGGNKEQKRDSNDIDIDSIPSDESIHFNPQNLFVMSQQNVQSQRAGVGSLVMQDNTLAEMHKGRKLKVKSNTTEFVFEGKKTAVKHLDQPIKEENEDD